MIDVQKKLDEVIQLSKERQQARKTVTSTTHKKVGMTYLEISQHEKEKMLNKVQRFYDSKIDGIYQDINNQLQAAGQPLLINPFTKG